MTFTITVTGERDAGRRCSFEIDWHDGKRPRGQCYFADPDLHARRLRADGHVVVFGVPTPSR
jgi:hypothetical protein